MKYQPSIIEVKWQRIWENKDVYQTLESSSKKKKYILDMFPYPSGEGLHVGHFKGYVATDILSRYYRFKGFNVLHPMGWDAFGLPAENYAIRTGIHPKLTTAKNIANIKKQMQMVGLSYDWGRELNTTDPNYYKWTQWIFLKLFEHGLAYEDEVPINWCPKDKTGLANEEVVNGKCERCGTEVMRKTIRQWILRITKYADMLLEDLQNLDWPQAIKDMQTNWIGKSEGVLIKFDVESEKAQIETFTTRIDTVFGVTALVLGPEHPEIKSLTTLEYKKQVEDYVKKASSKSDLERTALTKEKTGVFTGSFAINPLNNEKIPIWVADYILGFYGTGAVMLVPAHDERDFEFAKKFNLAIKIVVYKDDNWARSYLMGADNISDGQLKDLGIEIVEKTKSAARKIKIPKNKLKEYEKLIKEKLTSGFWNEYISDEVVFLFKDKNGEIERFVLNEDTNDRIDELAANYNNQKWSLPQSVTGWLAENDWYTDLLLNTHEGVLINSGQFTGLKSDVARLKITKYIESLQKGKAYVQYKLRDWIFSRQRYWGEPIPIVHCKKCGLVPVPEEQLPLVLPEVEKYEPTGTGESPLANIDEWVNTACSKCKGPAKRETNTMPQWAGSCWYYLRFTDPKNKEKLVGNIAEEYWLPVDWYVGGAEHAVLHLLYARFWHKFLFDIGVIKSKEPFQKLTNVGLVLAADGRKMSKSLGNVVTPERIVQEYGADTLRLYEAFMGPFENTISWDPASINGVYRFLTRVWEVINKDPIAKEDLKIEVALNKLIKKVGEDIEQMKFNTAVASMMEFINLSFHKNLSLDQKQRFLIILAPFAPHISEELWFHFTPAQVSSDKQDWSVHLQPWPKVEEKYFKEEEVVIVIQVNGKIRDQIVISKDILNEEYDIQKLAFKSPKVQKFLDGKSPKKIIYVSGKVLSLVV